MNIDKQVEIIEAQIHSDSANFSLIEKMMYLNEFFANDSEFSKDALDIVKSNICKKHKAGINGR